MDGNALNRLTGGALAIVLVLMILAPVIFLGCGGSSPEGAVSKFLDAWQDMDWEAYKASLAPEKAKLTKEQDELAKQKFMQTRVKIEGIKMETAYDKKDKGKAVVTLTDGKITYTAKILGEDKTDTQDIGKMEKERRPSFDTLKVDDVWYVDFDPG